MVFLAQHDYFQLCIQFNKKKAFAKDFLKVSDILKIVKIQINENGLLGWQAPR